MLGRVRNWEEQCLKKEEPLEMVVHQSLVAGFHTNNNREPSPINNRHQSPAIPLFGDFFSTPLAPPHQSFSGKKAGLYQRKTDDPLNNSGQTGIETIANIFSGSYLSMVWFPLLFRLRLVSRVQLATAQSYFHSPTPWSPG